ncbi:MAG TPA: cysteine dioxygenase family protein [Acetobacteraceae bacterium]
MIQLHDSERSSSACPARFSIPYMQHMFADIALAAATPIAQRHRMVAAALAPYLGMADLLRDTACPCGPGHYARHLLHAGPDYTVLAVVWRSGQMSPVHAHRSWCALGIHHGTMTETLFDLGPRGPAPRDCVQHRVGDTSHAVAAPDVIHRLANLGTETAVSIHVYGARYDRLGEQVNHVWAA